MNDARDLRSWTREYGVQLVILLAVIVAFAVNTPSFRGVGSIFATLENFALLGLVAVGISVTMIARELDLSAASVAMVSGVIAVTLSGSGLVIAVSAAVLASLAFGLAQGFLIAKLKINSMVFTVGTMTLLQGCGWLLSGGPITVEDFAASDLLLVRIAGVFSPPSLVAFVVFIVLAIVLGRTKSGREIYAIGGGRKEAIAAGVPLGRPIVLSFAIAAGCAGLAGAMAALKSGSVTPTAFGSLMLTGVAAALIGGIALAGGRGTVGMVAIGVGILAVISAGLSARGAQGYMTDLTTGAVLIVAVALHALVGVVGNARGGSGRSQGTTGKHADGLPVGAGQAAPPPPVTRVSSTQTW